MTDAQTRPQYAVIIPHYNDITRLKRCLDVLGPQRDAQTEVIVADNNSTVSLEEIRADYPWVRIVVETEKGAGPARNRGVAETDATWVLLIDSDCVPADDWLAVGREVADAGALIGGRVDVFDETPPPRSGAEAFETVFAFNMRAYAEDKGFLGSGNLVTARAVFEDVGGFRGAAVSEDVDWSRRAASKGYRLVYEDRFACAHPTRQDWDALRRKWFRVTQESFGLAAEKGLPGRLAWAGRALLMPLSVPVHLPRILADGRLSGQEKGRAAGTLLRLRLARMGWMLRQAVTGRA